MRSNQQMHVIGHHDKGVQLVTTKVDLSFPQGGNYHAGNFTSAKGKGAGRSRIQKPVHCDEGSSMCSDSVRGKNAIVRQTAMQPERDEDRLVDHITVW